MVLLNELNATNFCFYQVLIILHFLMFVQYFSASIGRVTNLAKGVLNIFCSIILWKTLKDRQASFLIAAKRQRLLLGTIVVFLLVVSIDDSYDLTSWN